MSIEPLGWNDTFNQSFQPYRDLGLTPARVAREDKGRYLVLCEHGELAAEVSGKFRHQAHSRQDFPAVGDWLAISPRHAEQKATIEAVLPRTSLFCRKTAGRITEEQPLAANIDYALLVAGLDTDFSPRRIERYLTVCYDSGASPVIVLTKSDLCAGVEALVSEMKAIALGVPVHPVCNLSGEGLEALEPYFRIGITSALLGSSGVGKSTLINRLLGIELLPTNELRYDGRGRHTTTRREMILLPTGGLIIDTPGMKELGLWADQDSLTETFEDIEQLAASCRFRDCTHAQEPGCAVREAVNKGTLPAGRLESFFKLRKEIAFLVRKEDVKARLEEKARWRQIHLQIRQREKFERRSK